MISSNTILQNRYLIIRQLGQGGMGTVYEALDQRVNAVVALKETIVGRDEESRRAFEREAGLLANLHHQALPKVMDYFAEGDGEFLVMEYVPGYDLAELLELRSAPFDVSQVLRWADELLKVLEYLHGRNPPVLHRDIKPSNLKLTKQGEIFLLDFGLAKGAVGQMPTMLTSRSVHGYTPVYAPLEQIHGKGTDPRSDLYSLGATLYHLLTASPPVDAPTRFDTIEDDKPDPLRPIDELNQRVPSSIARVIQQSMAISRKQRPPSAAEMRKALQRGEDNERRKEGERNRLSNESERQEGADDERRRKAAAEAAALAAAKERERLEEARRLEAAALRQEEQRRRQKEQQEAARRAELQRQAEEATPHGRALAEEGARYLEVERLRSEEESKPVESSGAKPAAPPTPTVRSQAPAIKENAAPQHGVKTWRAPAPERLYASTHDAPLQSNKLEGGKIGPTSHGVRKLLIILAAALVFAIIIAGAIALWLMREKTGQSSTSNQNQSQDRQREINTQGSAAAPAGMTYVPGGEFTMGLDATDGGDEYERPAHKVTVKPFYIDLYEVTREDYRKFLRETNRQPPPGWSGSNYPADTEKLPVTGVTWEDADAYAKWAGKRLPTEEEWEFAARGTDGRRYPWGKDWKAGLANADSASDGLAVVGSFKGASPFGTFDMVGNAWEWTASNLKPYPRGGLPAQLPGDLRVIRGGSYVESKNEATTTYRRGYPARGQYDYGNTGFRCAKDVVPPSR